MPKHVAPVYPATLRLLSSLGKRIEECRLRRRLSLVVFAERVGVSRETLYRVEAGDPTVAIGTYARALAVLGLDLDLNLVAKEDPVGRQLQDAATTVSRRSKKMATE